MVEEARKINSAEVEVYDRQIRLWGLDAQNRLRQSSVLLVGLTGLGAEVAKNLMLSGLKALTLMDCNEVSDADRCSQFLIASSENGNRALLSLDRVKQLNPMVEVSVDTDSVADKPEDYFRKFDLVVFIDQDFEAINKVDKICRKHKIRFQAGGVFGWIGYGFFDFNGHEFLFPKAKDASVFQNVLNDVDEAEDGSSGGTSKRARIEEEGSMAVNDIPTLTLEDEEDMKIKCVTFASFEQTFDVKLGLKKLLRRRFTFPNAYYVIRAFMQTMKEKNGCSFTKEEVIGKWRKELEEACLDENRQNFTPELFELFSKPALGPVCAVVGSVLSQEAIKAISQNDAPLKNVFLYDPISSSGVVCEISA